MMSYLLDKVTECGETNIRLLFTVLLLALVFVSHSVLLRFVNGRFTDAKVRFRWQKSVTYSCFLVGFIFLVVVWRNGFGSVANFVGLLSAGIAIAMRDPIVNLAGWLFLLLRRPFEVGDRIELGGHAGDVIDQRIFQFTLMEIGNWVDADQSTGRIIHIPNGKIFQDVLANYSKGFQYIWDEIPVLVTFESNWELAKEILIKIINKHTAHFSEDAKQHVQQASKKFLIYYKKLTPIVYTSVRESGVLLTIRFLTEPRQRRGNEEKIWEDILREFARCNDIEFAYPTQRFFSLGHDLIEGKNKA